MNQSLNQTMNHALLPSIQASGKPLGKRALGMHPPIQPRGKSRALPALSGLSGLPLHPLGSGWLEECSPRARLLCTLLLTLGLVLSGSVEQAGGFCLLGLFLAGLGRVAPARIVRTLISINIFMLFIWISLPFTVEGTPLLSLDAWLPLQISYEGTKLAALLSVKANGAALFLLALCGSLSLHTLGRTLQSCGVSHKLVLLFILLCRHISYLRHEFTLSLHSLRLRTAQVRGMQRLQVHACLVCSLLVRSADHAEKVRMALECKPYSLLYSPTSAQGKSLWPDTALCVTTFGLLCLSLA